MHPDLLIFIGISLVPILMIARYHKLTRIDRGVVFVLAGTIILSIAALVDYLEETTLAPLMDQMASKADWNLLVAAFGYIPGVILTGVGLSRWFIVAVKLDNEIRKRKRAEKSLSLRGEELKKALAAAEDANQAKNDFLAKMSHELRTPLNAIIGFSELMNKKLYGSMAVPEYEEYTGHIHDSGKLLLEIINDILDLAKVEAGKIELEEEAFFLHTIVSECLPIMEPRAEAADVKLISEAENDLVFWADPRILKQMLLNLLSNALKFTPEGGVVCVKSYARSDGSHVLEVSDTGLGMTEQEMALALEPFSQMDKPFVKKTHAGTGLGLALVSTFMGLHEGTLELASKKGKGTYARLVFPAPRAIKPEEEGMAQRAILGLNTKRI